MRSGRKPIAMALRRSVSPLPSSPSRRPSKLSSRDLVLWCLTKHAAREWGRPYGPGLLAFGLDPALFLIVEARNADDAAWALEEGLKSRALIAASPRSRSRRRSPRAVSALPRKPRARRASCSRPSGHADLPGTAHHAGASPREEQRTDALRRDRRPARRPGTSPLSAAGAKRRGEALSWSSVMSRFVSIFLPHLPIERLKRERAARGDAPLAG